MVRYAFDFGWPLADFLALLEPFRELGAPIPELDEESLADYGDFIPDAYEPAMLQIQGDPVATSYRDHVDALWLVQTAGKFGWTLEHAHLRMARLVPLGLVLEYPTEACPAEIVYWQDLLVITEFLDGQAPVVEGTVSAAHVAKAAAEVGETPERVRERLRKYAPLFGFTVAEEGEVA